jgi:drug/metabolite transporter (DMT)-like permease
LAVLLGLAAALSYSGADFLGGLLSRRSGVLPVVVLSQIASLVVLLLALAATGFGAPTVQGLAWGAAAGVIAGIGLLAYFRGLAVGRMALVAPTTAVVGAAVPVVAGLALGERPSVWALVGIGLAIVAVALVSLSPERAVQPAGVLVAVDAHDADVRPERVSRPGLVEALVAGVVFGLFFVFLNQAGPGGEGASGPLWPLLAVTAASMLPLGAVVAVRRRSLRPQPGSIPAIVASGVLGSAGSLLFLLAAQRGLLSLAAVLASLSPAGTVLLARVVLDERLHAPQIVGLVLAIAGAALIGYGGVST